MRLVKPSWYSKDHLQRLDKLLDCAEAVSSGQSDLIDLSDGDCVALGQVLSGYQQGMTLFPGVFCLKQDISREILEEIQDEVFDSLVTHGFGIDYEPTKTGVILEELIDWTLEEKRKTEEQ